MTSISTHFSLAKALYSFINTFLDISAVSVADVTRLGKGCVWAKVERKAEVQEVKGIVKHKLDVKGEE
jgi:hypothetical protein